MAATLVVLALIVVVGLGAFALSSWREGESRAARLACALAATVSLPILLSSLLSKGIQAVVLGLLALAGGLAVVLFLLPLGRVERGNDVPTVRFDERDVMFARARLEPGSPNFEAYYALRPEYRASDDKFRSLPGLLSPRSSGFQPLAFAATEASFALTGAVREAVDGPVSTPRTEWDARAMTGFIKELARYHGAHSVGVAELRPYHVYSHIGRGSGPYGAPLEVEHRFAVAFSVEMDLGMVSTAPKAPTLLESARQYVEAAKIAVQLGNFIRLLGHPARAHIDGNYRVIAPLVARDAGLGEIGRMGLLMTPALGPRVRLGVVTTDLPLIPDSRSQDLSLLDYCGVCQKCANCCPVRAIPKTGRQEVDGALRWRINDELCFRYWNAIGTDCARCIAVCPYSHLNVGVHRLVRWAVQHSGAARRATVRLDDLFYGRVPASKGWPGWLSSRGPVQ